MVKAMIEFLIQAGIEQPVAERAADGMMSGARLLLAGKMQDVAQTVQRFMDYDGTTAAGLRAALPGGFEVAVKEGFRAGTKRATEMSEGF